jgi:hypothetical protein
LWHGALAVDKPQNGLGLHRSCIFGKAPWAVSSLFGDLPKAAQTCLIRHEFAMTNRPARKTPAEAPPREKLT